MVQFNGDARRRETKAAGDRGVMRKEIGGGHNGVSLRWVRLVNRVFPLFIYIVCVCVCVCVCVFPFPLVSLSVCLSEREPMDGSHSSWPECDGQR